jgi:hypothetical protein
MSLIVAGLGSRGKLYFEPSMRITPEWMIFMTPPWREIVGLEQFMPDPPINGTDTWAWYERGHVYRTCARWVANTDEKMQGWSVKSPDGGTCCSVLP